MLKTLPETYCPYPWLQISTTPSAKVSMCCESQLYVPNVKLGDFLNSETLLNLRRELAAGVKEADGGRSTRMDVLERVIREKGEQNVIESLNQNILNNYFVATPEQLDIKLGNTCNLKCRMCTPTNSSKIWGEYVKHESQFAEFKDDFDGAAENEKMSFALPSLSELLEVSSTITRLNISGGEPTLMKGVLEYLPALVETGLSKNILLTFNTNATRVDYEILKLFREFRHVELYLSIDAIGSTYEYIRYPAKWPEVAKIVTEIRDVVGSHHDLSVSPVYQALNILNLPELLDWCQHHRLPWLLGNSVIHPVYQSPHALPLAIRSVGAARLESWLMRQKLSPSDQERIEFTIQHLRNEEGYNPSNFAKFIRHNAVLDKIRGQSLSESCPELFELINHSYSNQELT